MTITGSVVGVSALRGAGGFTDFDGLLRPRIERIVRIVGIVRTVAETPTAAAAAAAPERAAEKVTKLHQLGPHPLIERRATPGELRARWTTLRYSHRRGQKRKCKPLPVLICHPPAPGEF